MQEKPVIEKVEVMDAETLYPQLRTNPAARNRFFDKYFFYRGNGMEASEARKKAAYHAELKLLKE